MQKSSQELIKPLVLTNGVLGRSANIGPLFKLKKFVAPLNETKYVCVETSCVAQIIYCLFFDCKLINIQLLITTKKF